jgi:hypothetical protein
MPKAKIPVAVEEVKVQPVEQVQPVKAKRTRTMTPEALEKLQKARELALKARREGKQINEELQQAKKESFSEKIDQVETYRKLKSKVEDEVKVNEIVSINKKLEEFNSRFDGFLQDREKRKQEKVQRKEEKKAREIVSELPRAISQKMLEEEVKRQELERFRRKMFGI